MILLKLKSLLRIYRNAIQHYVSIKKFKPYLNKSKLQAVKALGKGGYANQLSHTQEFLKENNVPESRLSKTALYPVRQILTLKGTQEKFTGDLALRTVNGDVKIFSFNEKRVLNFIKDKAKFDELVETNRYFSDYFLTPIIEVNTENKCITEKLVDYTPVEQLSESQHNQILNVLVESTLAHISNLDPNQVTPIAANDLLKKLKEDFANQSIVKRLEDMIPHALLDIVIPQIPCHGDSQKNNILLADERVYFIDWEYAGWYLFYFDPIYMLIEPHIYRPDSVVAVEAFTEHNMRQIQKIFNVFELELNHSNLPYYLSLALIQRLNQAKINGNSNIEYDLFCFNRFLDSFDEKIKGY